MGRGSRLWGLVVLICLLGAIPQAPARADAPPPSPPSPSAPPTCKTTPLLVQSPSRTVEISFCLAEDAPAYSVRQKGREIVAWSRLGFELASAPTLQSGLAIAGVERSAHDQTWEQPWGEERYVRDAHSEMTVRLREATGARRELVVRFRAFDDGAAFRYEFPERGGIGAFAIRFELTEFRLSTAGAQGGEAWSIPAYRSEAYELLYAKTSPAGLPRYAHTPLTMRLPMAQGAGDVHISLHEAALVDWSSMQIENRGGGFLRAHLAPAPDGIAVRGEAPARSPWRTIQIAPSAAALLDSRLILNLNEPNRLGDVSYARPMKFIGIWRAMHLGLNTWASGPKHGATTARAKAYVDVAAELGMGGVLVEGWNVGWDSWAAGLAQAWALPLPALAASGAVRFSGDAFDFTKPYPDFDLREVARYARERGLELIGHHETAGAVAHYERQMEAAYALYRDVGVRTVKSGYVSARPEGEWHYGQRMARHYQLAAVRAAAYGIAVNAHEPIKDTGLRRTYPNMMTREGMRGGEYDAWGGGNPPSHTAVLPFTRGLSGPMDYTPGIFDLLTGARPGIDRVKSTIAKQLALFVVLYSPQQMAADLPENYREHPAFQFIRDVPVDWHESRGLAGEIGRYVAVARRDRASRDWYVGAISDEQARHIRLSLDFLEPGIEYEATAYRDGADADWQSSPFSIEIARFRARRGAALDLRLVSGGGQALRFAPVGPGQGVSK